MKPQRQPDDSAERETALDASKSFIVQAPAGSGKTELLIQRFLRLLAIVDEPEEILAITFTRKAAGEMRTRIENALRNARSGSVPDETHLRVGYDLARAAVDRDVERGWGLADQPARLRINTIDSVNLRLSRRVPLSAGLTSHNAMLEDPAPLYRDAAHETLALAESTDANGEAVRVLLAHCDNDVGRVERLLTTMLARRDQWLSRTGSGRIVHESEFRASLEGTLRELVEGFLEAANVAFPAAEKSELLTCLVYAGENLITGKPEHVVTAWHGLTQFPLARTDGLSAWKGIAASLLTGKGDWRKTVNKNDGFPVDNDAQRAMKERFLELLGRLADQEVCRDALEPLAGLPEPAYPESQWVVLESLFRALPMAVAVLKQLFSERGLTDYPELAQEALAALGTDEEATELRLALDYQLKHILLDEFQDTSRSQFELIRKLTEGWQTEPDRSVFLVGDPMQSIYRFREAEVGLFLECCAEGLGDLKLDALVLTTNFRSDVGVIEWFNDAFATVFPGQNDPMTGAVTFSPSAAFNRPQDGKDPAVTWHPVPGGLPEVEADQVVELIQQTLASHHGEDIGVLVRSRKHAVAIAAALREADIDYVATALEQLHEQPVVQDLLALTRAITHLADRLAWLACLRGPWCGLTLKDLHRIAAPDHDSCIWTLINNQSVVNGVSADGRVRLERFRTVMSSALDRRGGMLLRDLVENTWLRLGGPATVRKKTENSLEVAQQYFSFLGSLDVTADCVDGTELLARLSEKPVTRSVGDNQVQILTMHKAKGLEFDTVILPGLGRITRTSDKPLLLFDEIEKRDGTSGLIVAPIKASDQSSDPLYDLLWRFETKREQLEQARLLYVAVTRARRRLHLFAQLKRNPDDAGDIKPPAANSLLARLWPVAERAIDVAGVDLPVHERQSKGDRALAWAEAPLWRLSPTWAVPAPPKSLGTVENQSAAPEEEPLEFEWAKQWSKHVGTVVHRWLQQIAEDGIDSWDLARVTATEPQLRRALRHCGTAHDQLDVAIERVSVALKNTITDASGSWILSAHAEAANELPLTTQADNGSREHIIDRTFIDADGVRWIIDYKTGQHEGGDLRGFLESEANRYRSQLQRYRDAVTALEDRPVKTALYFPAHSILHEVEPEAS
jgi:ATP-dependent helicase/nuclease subunit A